MIVLTLPYPLSSNKYWRPVHIGNHITIVPTKDAKEYKSLVGWTAKAAGVLAPLQGRVSIDIQLFPSRPQDYLKRMKTDPMHWDDTVRCIDLDNANKVLLDALKGVAIVDDSWVRSITSERMEPDGEARVIVSVRPYVRANCQQPSLLEPA
ncbi:Endodeoxyribonuclease RusA [compost metagenome]|nr:MAG TPA: Endodeoxyribonuclease RusA [Caudoviricetes sp.]